MSTTSLVNFVSCMDRTKYSSVILKCKWYVWWCYSLNCVTVSHSVYKILIEFYDLNGAQSKEYAQFFSHCGILCDYVSVCMCIRASFCPNGPPHYKGSSTHTSFSRKKREEETERMTFLFVFIHSLCHFSVSIGRWTE